MPIPNIEYYKEFSQGCKIYIESGTYRCGSLEIARSCDLFDEIHSIEVVPEFYEAAVEKYKNDSRVKLWLGYSPDVLRESILPNLNKRVTFWLDGHVCGDNATSGYSKYGQCPLLHEIEAIKESSIKDHIIFMDDQRQFGTHYFDNITREQYFNKVLEINTGYKFKHLDGGFSDGQQHLPDDIIVAYL